MTESYRDMVSFYTKASNPSNVWAIRAKICHVHWYNAIFRPIYQSDFFNRKIIFFPNPLGPDRFVGQYFPYIVAFFLLTHNMPFCRQLGIGVKSYIFNAGHGGAFLKRWTFVQALPQNFHGRDSMCFMENFFRFWSWQIIYGFILIVLIEQLWMGTDC